MRYDNVEGGQKHERHGKNGKDIFVEVPAGVVLREYDSDNKQPGQFILDMDKPGIQYLAAKGGRGGRGNMFFKSSTNRSPKEKQLGELGELKYFQLELKTMADVGLVVITFNYRFYIFRDFQMLGNQHFFLLSLMLFQRLHLIHLPPLYLMLECLNLMVNSRKFR
jgi:hypothetical protein